MTVTILLTKSVAKVQERFVELNNALLVEHPLFGYRKVPQLVAFKKNTV